MGRASKKKATRGFCTPPRAALAQAAPPSIPRCFVGNRRKARAVLRVEITLWCCGFFEREERITEAENLNEKRWQKSFGAGRDLGSELVFHTRLLLLTFREFHIVVGGKVICVWDAWKMEIIALTARDNDPENNVGVVQIGQAPSASSTTAFARSVKRHGREKNRTI